MKNMCLLTKSKSNVKIKFEKKVNYMCINEITFFNVTVLKFVKIGRNFASKRNNGKDEKIESVTADNMINLYSSS